MEQDPMPKASGDHHRSLFYDARSRQIFFHSINPRHIVLLLCSIFLLCGSYVTSLSHPQAYAESKRTTVKTGCFWHRVTNGDTLNGIAHAYRSSVATLARTNNIRNINLIFTGQNLCIPSKARWAASGVRPNGRVTWYAYGALEWSNRQQARSLLCDAAARYGLPANLMLAIAWQESGWNQHVIARDGGIGLMQIMPYTAQGLNRQVNGHYDPYKLQDNIELGAIYLHSLWHGFHGNKTKIISAYNEGGWNVKHRGIFNWRYVNSVHALMQRY
ncbi:hypothetical protein KDA_03100 [Dictyobacter alpinus]|uniref:LysM domain-containing protein n=1 Tax=Dictyobacter alpinus TaxID=2014873 RepID=A0A402B0F2_9CHLR|nr:transglycosylase SLT domain-containing protein [Dictyobacter alpinus]GCE24826.1 hypothetical protein KDA_03100 [Dictyobacter alpinus]